MKIKKLEYHDQKYQWKLEPVEFSENINLFVGVSGSGKTRILRAINNLKSIVKGDSFEGVTWNVSFLTSDNIKYHWSGEFAEKENTDFLYSDSEEKDKFKIVSETLQCNDTTIFERKKDEIIFNGNKMPKLSPFESVIKLLKQEDTIFPINKEWDKLILTDLENQFFRYALYAKGLDSEMEKSKEKLKKNNLSFLELKELDIPSIVNKLILISKLFPEKFAEIKNIFTTIFPNVSDIKIETDKDLSQPILEEEESISEYRLKNNLFILKHQEDSIFRIKEKGCETWIENISSGMLKTLIYLTEIYTSPDNSVILIDEFENSLGVNCMDSVTDLILEREDLQFILTSHHPYVINNIGPAYWKIVTRQGGLVTVKNAEDFHISKSRQKAFIDLINVLDNEDEDWED